jgi:stress response protein YsnF
MDNSSSPKPVGGTETVEVVPIVEETAFVSKRQVAAGKVRVHTRVDTVEELARASLRSDKVDVTRVPIDKVVDRIPDVRTEGDVTIVPVMEEVLVVETKLVLKEEIHIRHYVETENVEVPVTLRRQRAVVERLDAEDRPLADEERTNEP